MDIKHFVQESICQIVEATAAASGPLKKHRAKINPKLSSTRKHDSDKLMHSDISGHMVIPVEFDLAITIDEVVDAKGQAKLKVFGLGSTGGSLGSTTSNSTLSRVRFVVPIQLPLADE
jgi:hypothetical protein